jgi:hypothetical protein
MSAARVLRRRFGKDVCVRVGEAVCKGALLPAEGARLETGLEGTRP